MAEPAGTLVSSLLRRVRDPQAGATSRDFARDVLSRCQQITNLGIQAVLGEVTFATEPLRIVYPFLPTIPTAARIVGMVDGGRDLALVPSTEFRYVERAWFRSISDRFEAYALLGQDLFVLWPGKVVASTIDITFATRTSTLVNDDTEIVLPPEDFLVAMDLAEAVLLLRQREYSAAQDLASRLKARIQAAR